MNNKAFTLTELLVSSMIVGMLFFVGGSFYKKRTKESYSTWAKQELAGLARLMNMAKNYDGFYHQYIAFLSYRPKGTLYAVVGTGASATVNCCNKYPELTDSPCKKDERSGFLYYRCDNTAFNRSTDNVEICGDSNYNSKYECDINGLSAISNEFDNNSRCKPEPAAWCDCDNFTLGARDIEGKKLTINQLGTVCIEK